MVLVVENDADELDAITGLMEHWGIHSIEAPTARHAADLIDEIGIVPDAILTDYQLDGERTGLSLVGDLRNRFGKLPACMVTGNHGMALERQARQQSVELLTKPLAPPPAQVIFNLGQEGRKLGLCGSYVTKALKTLLVSSR